MRPSKTLAEKFAELNAKLNRHDHTTVRSASPALSAPFDPAGRIDPKDIPDPYAGVFTMEWGGSFAPDEAGCKHDLKPYRGFTESYQYCTKCDHKEYGS